MIWFAYAYMDYHETDFSYWMVNIVFIIKGVESPIRRTSLFSFDYKIADKDYTSTFLAVLHSFYNGGVVLPEGIYPITLDNFGFWPQIIFGCIYNVVFFTLVYNTLMELQKKPTSE